MARRIPYLTLEQAIQTAASYFEKQFGVTIGKRRSVVLENGTWIEFEDVVTKDGEEWADDFLVAFGESQ